MASTGDGKLGREKLAGLKNRPRSPCLSCGKKPNCPAVCYPRRDYLRALKKAGRRRQS